MILVMLSNKEHFTLTDSNDDRAERSSIYFDSQSARYYDITHLVSQFILNNLIPTVEIKNLFRDVTNGARYRRLKDLPPQPSCLSTVAKRNKKNI